MKNIKLYETVIIREHSLKLSRSQEIIETLDEENRIINTALYFIKMDVIPFRNKVVHSDNSTLKYSVSDFEYNSNQGLIEYKMLLNHINDHIDYYNRNFQTNLIKSL